MYFQQLNFNIGYNCVYVDCQITSEYGLRLFSCWWWQDFHRSTVFDLAIVMTDFLLTQTVTRLLLDLLLDLLLTVTVEQV